MKNPIFDPFVESFSNLTPQGKENIKIALLEQYGRAKHFLNDDKGYLIKMFNQADVERPYFSFLSMFYNFKLDPQVVEVAQEFYFALFNEDIEVAFEKMPKKDLQD